MRKQILLFLVFAIPLGILAQEKADLDAISKIKKEGTENSQVMDIAWHLTDWSGPRLTNSPGYARAANWAKQQLSDWGLKNAALEPWGEFGKGWEQKKCYVAIQSPYYVPLIAQALAWTGSTNGMISANVELVKAKDSVELSGYAGKLKGKVVMLYNDAQLEPSFEADGSRLTDEQLEKMASGPSEERQRSQAPTDDAARAARMERFRFTRMIRTFIADQQPALVLEMNPRGSDGTIFASSGGSYAGDAAIAPASVMLSSDDFLRIQRLVENGTPVTIDADVQTQFYSDDLNAYNVIAEIPGTDPTLKAQMVMLGGHLDSWQASTGATDNAAGCAVMMEAVRLIMASGLKPKRTIRIALWSGEEEGLLGSRGYVKKHFADPADMKLLPEQKLVSAYYNLDNGTGKIRGVYMQGNEKVKSIFANWLAPFQDMGASTLTINNTGGTDHLSFDAVGIPGFQFIQDPVEYNTRTHHTNMDSYDHLVAADLQQAAIIVASFVYQTAQRPEMMPRKELPKPRGERRGF